MTKFSTIGDEQRQEMWIEFGKSVVTMLSVFDQRRGADRQNFQLNTIVVSDETSIDQFLKNGLWMDEIAEQKNQTDTEFLDEKSESVRFLLSTKITYG